MNKLEEIKNIQHKIQKMYDDKILKGSIHLSCGQEAADLGIIKACEDLGYNFFIFGNHRSFGQYLYFATEDNLLKEIKEYKGQHLYIPNKILTTGIQGGLTAVAVGYGMTVPENKKVLCFIGDGTLGQGILYESLQLASLFKPRTTFIIIDNEYSMSKTKFSPNIKYLAKYFNLSFTYIKDGWNFNSVFKKAKKHWKKYDGPGIIYIKCKRLCGHSCSDTQRYRPKEELMEKFKIKYESRIK